MIDIIDKINNIIWCDALVYLCLATGIYFTILFGIPQLRYLKQMIRLLFSRSSSAKGISSFQAFSLAISERVGTGNIAGVATAIAMGGPGIRKGKSDMIVKAFSPSLLAVARMAVWGCKANKEYKVSEVKRAKTDPLSTAVRSLPQPS